MDFTPIVSLLDEVLAFISEINPKDSTTDSIVNDLNDTVVSLKNQELLSFAKKKQKRKVKLLGKSMNKVNRLYQSNKRRAKNAFN